MGSLDGTAILITGGGSGIGLATAELFLDEGAGVTIADRDPARLRDAVAALTGRGVIHAVTGDVVSPADADRMVAGHLEAHGRLDYLYTCAGIPGIAPIETLDEALWDRVIDVNLKGTYTMIRAAVPHMKGQGGAIVTMGSEAGITGQPDLTAYCASKGGVINMTRALALELIPFGIRVNCLSPGITNTPMCRIEAEMAPDPAAVWEAWKSWAPIGRWAEPMEQARAVLFLMRDATFCVGSVLVSDGGYTAI